MQRNTGIIIAVIALVVGLGIGYGVSADRASDDRYENDQNSGGMMHMMSDGQMMQNSVASTSMTGMMSDMNAALRGKTGDEFDKAFLAEMIVHHQGAVEMAQLALTNANHQEIKDLANGIIIAQNKEIAEMKGWQKIWFNQ